MFEDEEISFWNACQFLKDCKVKITMVSLVAFITSFFFFFFKKLFFFTPRILPHFTPPNFITLQWVLWEGAMANISRDLGHSLECY